MAKQVSVIFLVKNPPMSRLAALVEYLRPIADQFVIVVDDRTDTESVKVMQSWPGVETVAFTWVDDFAKARNAALPYVRNPWTLHVDPDELPSVEAMKYIERVTDPDAPKMPLGYVFWFRNFWGGVLGPSENYHWHIRLWRTGHGRFYRAVHELVELDGMNESHTRGTRAPHAPEAAYFIHSKPTDMIESDQAYYELLGERSL
jgi:hypothetical protein